MSRNSNIGWTDHSWNPLRATPGMWHCVKISEGCKNCYAAAFNQRLHNGPDYRVGAAESLVHVPTLMAPLTWRKPGRVFVCSMTDLFLESHLDSTIDHVFAIMAMSQRNTFQVLTKRAKRMRDYMTGGFADRVGALIKGSANRSGSAAAEVAAINIWHALKMDGCLPNVWMGVSAENQERLEERIGPLCETPAAVRFLSCEPLLTALDFSRVGGLGHLKAGIGTAVPGIDWVIVGGESGKDHRPCEAEWITDIAAQCSSAGVPCFVKQDAAFKSEQQGRIPDDVWARKEFPRTEVPA